MKTHKKVKTPSRFTRGVKMGAKSSRRHGRKQAGKIQPKEEIAEKLDTLTTL